jgi:putative SOS response-associated peptidase YedK
VRAIHDKAMPVLLLTAADVEPWLTGSSDDALVLQKPAADDVLELVPLKAAA